MWCADDCKLSQTLADESVFVKQEPHGSRPQALRPPDDLDALLFGQIDALLKEHHDQMLGKIECMMQEQTQIIRGSMQQSTGCDSRPPEAPASLESRQGSHLIGGQKSLSTASAQRRSGPYSDFMVFPTRTNTSKRTSGLRSICSHHSRHSLPQRGPAPIRLFNSEPHPGLDLAHTRAWIRYLVKSNFFELFFAVVIMTNAIFVGIQVNYNAVNKTTTVPISMFVIQAVYCAVFLFEMILRMIAEGVEYCNPMNDKWWWNVLDMVVVSTSIAEMIIDSISLAAEDTFNGSKVRDAGNVRVIRILRIVRMVRIVRIAKILKFIHALRTFIYSILATVKSLVWALLLLAIIIYVFGIVLTQSVSDFIIDRPEGPQVGRLNTYWGNLPKSMFTLFKSICGGLSWHDGVHPMAEVGFAWVLVFIAYISFTYFAVLNVVTGIFCHSAIETAQQNEDLVVQIQMANKKSYIDRIKRIFKQIDDDGSETITMSELEAHLSDETMQAIFTSLEIETDDVVSLFRLLDTDRTNYIDLDEFVSGLMRLRGNAKRVDVLEIQQTLKKIGERVSSIYQHRVPGGSKSGASVQPDRGRTGSLGRRDARRVCDMRLVPGGGGGGAGGGSSGTSIPEPPVVPLTDHEQPQVVTSPGPDTEESAMSMATSRSSGIAKQRGAHGSEPEAVSGGRHVLDASFARPSNGEARRDDISEGSCFLEM